MKLLSTFLHAKNNKKKNAEGKCDGCHAELPSLSHKALDCRNVLHRLLISEIAQRFVDLDFLLPVHFSYVFVKIHS